MRILLTRPFEQSQMLSALLKAKDIEVEIFPLMTVHQKGSGQIPKDNYQVMVFTSANSLRFSDLDHLSKNTMIFTVGNKTASEAQALGFTAVISADGNLEKLSETIKNKLSPADGPLLYIRGKHTAGPLADDLRAARFDVSEHVVYETRPVAKLDKVVINMLLHRHIDFIPFYSQRSALIFKELITRASLENSLAHITALCISKNVAKEIGSLPWKTIMISDRPTQSDLFKLIAVDL